MKNTGPKYEFIGEPLGPGVGPSDEEMQLLAACSAQILRVVQSLLKDVPWQIRGSIQANIAANLVGELVATTDMDYDAFKRSLEILVARHVRARAGGTA